MRRRDFLRQRRIMILCEGDTEEIGIKHFLKRQWDRDGLASVGLHPINLNGKLEDIFSFVPLYRQTDAVIAVFTLIDLYGMTRVTHGTYDDISTKVQTVKNWLRNGLDTDFSGFFYPHLCVHETEAWFLAEGRCLGRRLNDPNLTPEPSAELQNFGNHPSLRINRLFKSRRGSSYHKINDAIALFKCLEFEPVYSTCTYFRSFYDELVSSGRAGLAL